MRDTAQRTFFHITHTGKPLIYLHGDILLYQFGERGERPSKVLQRCS